MTTQSEREALEQARQAGVQEAIDALRTFTGISGYTPDLTKAEHHAYLVYEEDLRVGLEVWTEHLAHANKTVGDLIKKEELARQAMESELQRRQSERADGKAGARILGALKDVTFQEKRDHSLLGRKVEEAWQEVYRCTSRVQEVEAELADVTRWVERMFADIEASRSGRQERHESERLDREYSERDVSSRWCAVYTPDEFVNEDARRLLRRQRGSIVLEGSILSYKWRSDVHDSRDEGNWMLVWNATTKETFLELAGNNLSPTVWLLGAKISTEKQALEVFMPLEKRGRERNSLALVLDTYAAL